MNTRCAAGFFAQYSGRRDHRVGGGFPLLLDVAITKMKTTKKRKKQNICKKSVDNQNEKSYTQNIFKTEDK